jgi:iron(III) transport system ATP-binding protein
VVEQADTPVGVFESPATRFVATFMGDADFLPARSNDAGLVCEIGIVSTIPGWGPEEQVDVVLRPHEVAMRTSSDGPAEVVAVDYRGPFVLHTLRLASGRTVRSWQPHSVRHSVGTRVEVSLVPGETPTLLVDDLAVTEPRQA